MHDEGKTKEQLIHDLVKMRGRIAELESSNASLQRAEEEQRRREELYGTILENLPAWIMLFDRQGRCLKTNKPGGSLMGFEERELLNKNFSEIWPKDSRPIVDKAFRQALEGAPSSFETSFIKPDGDNAFWSVRLNAVHDKDGEIGTFLAIGADITDYKQTENELKRHRGRLQKLVDERTAKLKLFSQAIEKAMDGVQIIDLNGYVLYSNKAVEEIYGYPAGELTGKRFNELNVDHGLAEKAIIPGIYETGRWTGEVVVYHRDGHQLPTWLSASMVKDENGDPVVIIGIIRDITGRKQAEEALLRSEKKFRTLFDSATDAIFILDLEGNFIDANQSAYERRGYTKEEMLSMHISQLETPEFAAKTPERIEQHKKYGHVVFETAHLKKDGTILPVEVDSRIIDFDGREVFFSINRDITERKKMEENILKIRKLESVGILAGGIAHDFNNLLQGILGNISFALEFADPNSKVFKPLKEAENASERAKELSYRLLTFARGGEPIKKEMLIQKPLKESALFALSDSPLSCEFNVPEDLYPVEIDEGQMNQVITNLIVNAREAMPAGGTINVSAKNLVVGQDNTLSLQQGKYLELSIEDHGVGIPEENLTKIFDPYFTTKGMGTQKGEGLGLAICHSIVKKHGGMISVKSTMGSGSTFTIYLPASQKTK